MILLTTKKNYLVTILKILQYKQGGHKTWNAGKTLNLKARLKPGIKKKNLEKTGILNKIYMLSSEVLI